MSELSSPPRRGERRERAVDDLGDAPFREFFAHSLDGLMLAAPDGRIFAVNPAACVLLRRTEAEICRLGRDGVLDPEDPRAAELLQRRCADGQIRGTVRFRRGDGTRVEVEVASTLFRDARRRRWTTVILRDATERERARQALAESEHRLRRQSEERQLQTAALIAAANAVVITDPQGRIEWANPAFTAFSGWALEHAIGRTLIELVEAGDNSQALATEVWTALRAGKVWRGEVVNRRNDGVRRTIDMTITPVREVGGEITHFIVIKQDITERKQMTAQLARAQRMEALGTMASGVAHDLNNILAPILLIGGMLQQRAADPAQAEFLSIVNASARRGSEIIRQLLTFSRGQPGEKNPVQPRHILKEILGILRETFPRAIEIRALLQPELWTILADPTQLHQVMLNLCVNGRDAMPAGGVLTVRADNVTVAADAPELPPGTSGGNFVRIAVTDTGGGISPEIRERIFDPFFTTKPPGQGTGLGLSTVEGIVRDHGGFVSVESAVNCGSTFRVHLPAITERAPGITDEAPTTAAHPTGTTVLVVDDEAPVLTATHAVLAAQYRVLTAADGLDALKQFLARRGEIAVVVTDLMMPVMDGTALIRSLRALDPKVRIVVTTGLLSEAHEREIATLSIQGVLRKPADPSALLTAVSRALYADPRHG